MNVLDILRLMAKAPAICAVQIADALDKDLAEVSNAMRDLVDSGSVVQSKGVAPDGAREVRAVSTSRIPCRWCRPRSNLTSSNAQRSR